MTLFWVIALALTILLYILLDGFDLGVGILFLFSRDEMNRRRMMSAITPVWDGNETWLILAATILFGAFSRAFALALSALYLPALVGISALILRGVSFEFRARATSSRRFWDTAFAAGSLVATFVQGAALGALATGVPVVDDHYAGGTFGWLSIFSVLCGVALCTGYSLLGTSWIIKKCEGRLRDAARKLLPWLVATLFAVAVLIVLDGHLHHLRVLDRWTLHPDLLWIPVATAVGTWLFLGGSILRPDDRPFLMATGIFSAAFATVAVSFWPYMIPYALTVDQAASPAESTYFMFWGLGLLALPLTLAYTLFVYRTFRGKVVVDAAEYD